MSGEVALPYPRHNNSFYGGARHNNQIMMTTADHPSSTDIGRGRHKHQHQYSSDSTLLEDKGMDGHDVSGRRSALDHYSSSPESDNMARQERKAKKKKMKKLKSFMSVFLGGLRKHQLVQGSSEVEHQGGGSSTIQQGRRNNDSAIASSNGSSSLHNQSESPHHHHFPHHHHPGNTNVPGLCGLHNHGNTCFMNAILQCLSNTDHLAEYFVTDQYKNDLNRQRLSARSFGSRGDITEQFAILLKCLWNGQYDARITGWFKEVCGKHASQYQGSSQHDAQEFFLWLLDSVHEDLNQQGGKKKYRPIKDSAGRPDEEVAAETLQSHMKRNNSFIQNMFQGQFRSSVTCPSCTTRSATFDPYVCVSLPLPQRERRPIYVTVVYRSSSRSNRVFGANMPIEASIRDLRNTLAEMCGINRYHMVLTDLLPNGFNRTFYDDQHLSVIKSGDMVFGFECPPYRGDNPEAITQANPSGSKELMLMLVVNKLGQTQFGKRFGPPLILRVWRDLTHSQFQSVVLKAMASYLREGIRLADVCQSGTLFRCNVVDGLPDRLVLPTNADHPFYSPSIDKALHVSMLYGGPAHVKLVAEWDPEVKARVFGVVSDEVPEPHHSVMELRQIYQKPLTASLDDCLKIYTKEETLNREDSWFCPHCKHQQQDATKKITLWTLPDVLVIHLKRFRHIGYCRTKLNTLVSFPYRGLDMTPYLAPRSSQRPASATLHRRNQISSMRAKTLPSHSKSVRFEDHPANNKNITNRGSAKESKFHFPWKKKKESEDQHMKRSEAVFTPGVCDSPSSVRSAPSTMGNNMSRGGHQRVHSPVHSVDGSDTMARSRSPGNMDQDNVYDLYAVCNHLGTMTRGHYTAYCRNPADAHWYMFDDSKVQPLEEEDLVTPGAYLLFYVRQSLLNQFPPLSSASSSSSSSGGSSHWAMHIPRFKLDLTGSLGSSEGTHSPSTNDTAKPHTRLGSISSAVSAPPTSGGSRGYTPPHDTESDVFVHSHPASGVAGVDNHSGISLPQAGHINSPLHYHQLSPYHQPHIQQASPISARLGSGGRHASLRLARSHQFDQLSPTNSALTNEQYLRRGTSFHGSHYPESTMLTDSGRVVEFPPHPAFPSSGQGLATPSRSIPNMTDFPTMTSRPYPLPSRSIPDMPVHMSPPPPSSSKVFTSQNYGAHFMTPQPQRQRSAASRSFSIGQNSGTESCV